MSKPTPEASSPRPYESAYESYWQLGWTGILPLPPRQKASPPEGLTGWSGDWPSYADIFAWSEERPAANVALRLPTHLLGIDVDHYKGKLGGNTIATYEAQWGPLPPTWRSTSRDDGVSGIRFYAVPPGLGWVGGLPSVELIHFGHRYAVVAPSIHPEGRAYRWIDPGGATSLVNPSAHDMPWLPARWILGLSTGQHAFEARADMDSEQTWTWIGQLPGHNIAMCTFMATWVAKAVADISAHAESRHDVTRDQVLAVVRFGEQGHTGTSVALDRIRSVFIRLVTDDSSRTAREASAEWGRIVDGAVRIVAANPEITLVEGDPCPPIIATLQVPRLTSPVIPGEVVSPVPPAQTPPAQTQPRLTSPGVPGEVPEVPEPDTWQPADLKTLLLGDTTEAPPSFLMRADGRSLLYPARVNGIIGASESAKTWLMLFGVVQAVQAGINVGYLDFEDGWKGITNRLKALGLTAEQIWTHIAYVNPDRAFDSVAEGMLREMLGDHRPQLVVLDGVNAAMTLNGWDLLSNKDATAFSQKILKPIARTEAAVSYVDHLPKNATEAAGAIGAQAKRAMTTGCAIKVEVERVFGVGQRGELRLSVDKDRSGIVRGYCPIGTSALGIAHLASNADGTVVSIHIEPATRVPVRGTDPALHPVMEAISQFLERMDGPMSAAAIERGVRGYATDTKRDAIDRLVIEGYVGQERVGQSLHHTHIRAFRTDPFGSDLPPTPTSPTSPEPRLAFPGEVAEGDLPRPARSLSERGSSGEVVRGIFEDLLEETSPEAEPKPGEVEDPAVPSGHRYVGGGIAMNADGDFYRVDTGEQLTQKQADKEMDDQ